MEEFGYFKYDREKLLSHSEEDIVKSETDWIEKHLLDIDKISYRTLEEDDITSMFESLFPNDENYETLMEAIESNYKDIFEWNFKLIDGGQCNDINDFSIRPCFICKCVELKNGSDIDEIIGICTEPIELVGNLLDYVIKKIQKIPSPPTVQSTNTILENKVSKEPLTQKPTIPSKPKYQSKLKLFSSRNK